MIEGFWQAGPLGTVPRPYVRVAVLVPEFGTSIAAIDFLVDTGADTTCVHPLDAIRLGIPVAALMDPNLWPAKEPAGGIGGSAVYYVVDALYGFLQDNGGLPTVSAPIRIGEPREENLRVPHYWDETCWPVLRWS